MQYASNNKISYQKDLSETSEAFFAASVLVNLKAQVLESDVFKDESLDYEEDIEINNAQAILIPPGLNSLWVHQAIINLA